MKFSIPYNGDKNFISKLVLSGLSEHVEEIYFAGNPHVMGSGRRPKIKDYIVKNGDDYVFDHVRYDQEIINLISDARNLGIKTNLLMNFHGLATDTMVDYVSGLLRHGINSVTVGSKELLRQAKTLWPVEVDIQNSVYIDIDSLVDVEELVDMGVTIFLLPPDLNHDVPKIISINKLIDKYKSVKLKIMINEGCIKYCPHRRNDQLDAQNYSIESAIRDFITDSEKDRYLGQPCRSHMNNRGIGKTNYISPRNIEKYLQFDPIFKIVGRSFETELIFQSVQSYLSSQYNGDMRCIVENFKHSKSVVPDRYDSKTSFLLSNEVT